MARRSVLTDDLKHCIVTGSPCVHIHHVFGGANRKHSEADGFIIPLRPEFHNMSDQGIHFNREMDLHYKRLCQEYFEKYMGTQKQFISRYGKSWL